MIKLTGDICRNHVYGSSLEGVAMGVKIANVNIILFKTFITYEMTKGKQISVFARNEEIRKEIYGKETMGMIRK